MATLNFLYRSKKDNATLNLRLLFRLDGIDKVIGAKSKFEVSKLYWTKYHNQKSPRDIEMKNLQTEVSIELNKIENSILKAFNKVDNSKSIDKLWLKQQMDLYYNPKPKAEQIPTEIIKYFDYFIKDREKELKTQTIRNYYVVKKLLIKYEKSIKKTLKIKDIDNHFKKSFVSFCTEEGYAINTIARSVQSIKGICNHAKFNGIATSYQLDKMRVKEVKVDKIYLTFEELKIIEELNENDLSESYINARDWLIISCYTGQRVSDFMKFTKEKIRIEKGKSLIEFTQKKTGKIMTVPLHSKVLEILKERNGNFPREISSQKYNDYIKEVCKEAKINDNIKGSKLVKTDNNDKFPYRKGNWYI